MNTAELVLSELVTNAVRVPVFQGIGKWAYGSYDWRTTGCYGLR